jgi:hypothetical protein
MISRLASDTAKRIAPDEVGSSIAGRVVNGMKADVDEGEDGELYAATGFTRQSHRRTGLRHSAVVEPFFFSHCLQLTALQRFFSF